MDINDIIALFGVVLASNGLWGYVQYKAQQKAAKKSGRSSLEKGVMFLLREDLIRRCDHWLQPDLEIPLHEWDSIRAEDAVYKDLGGNGDVAERIELLEEKVRRQLTGKGV